MFYLFERECLTSPKQTTWETSFQQTQGIIEETRRSRVFWTRLHWNSLINISISNMSLFTHSFVLTNKHPQIILFRIFLYAFHRSVKEIATNNLKSSQTMRHTTQKNLFINPQWNQIKFKMTSNQTDFFFLNWGFNGFKRKIQQK